MGQLLCCLATLLFGLFGLGCSGPPGGQPDAATTDAPSDGMALDAMGDAAPDADEGSGFRIRTRAFGVRAPVEARLRVGGVTRSTIQITHDGMVRFPQQLPDQTAYELDVVAAFGPPPCSFLPGSAVLTSDVVVDLFCDGVTELASIALPPMIAITPEFRPAATSYTGIRPFLLDSADALIATATEVYTAPPGQPIVTISPTTHTHPTTNLTITVTHAGVVDRTYRFALDAFPVIEAYLKPPLPQVAQSFSGASTSAPAAFGFRPANAIAVQGDVLVVGAPFDNAGTVVDAGAVFVFRRAQTSWTLEQTLRAPIPEASEGFGFSVALDGDRIVVGAPRSTGIGKAYVYRRGATAWDLELPVLAASVANQFGVAVAIADTTIAIGAPDHDGGPPNGKTGAVCVFRHDGTAFVQTEIVANTAAASQFGATVALSGTTMIVGAWGELSSDGAAYLWFFNGTSWVSQHRFAPGLAGRTGWAVAIAGDDAAVGSPFTLTGGVVQTLHRTGTTWTADPPSGGVKSVLTAAGDNFGVSVGLQGNHLLVGAWHEDGSGTGPTRTLAGNEAALNAGAVHGFRRMPGWTEQLYIKASNTNASDRFGPVAVDGDTFVVGAPDEGSCSTDQTNNGCVGAGAVYVFR